MLTFTLHAHSVRTHAQHGAALAKLVYVVSDYHFLQALCTQINTYAVYRGIPKSIHTNVLLLVHITEWRLEKLYFCGLP